MSNDGSWDGPASGADDASEDDLATVDFVVGAYLEDGRWQVTALPRRAATDLDTLVHTLHQQPGDIGALGLISFDEDFFILARVAGSDLRLLLSDATAATDFSLAREVLDRLGVPVPLDEDEIEAAGDLAIVGDLGYAAEQMEALCDNTELYPDEMLSEVAVRLGFADQFRASVEAFAG